MSESIIKKIKALHNKAESAKELGNVKEAESFILKVTELLNKYNLEQSILKDADEEEITDSGRANGIKYYKTPYNGLWETDLIAILTEMNFCTATFSERLKIATIVGKPQNIEVVKYLYDVCEPLFSKLAIETYEKKVKETRDAFKVMARSRKEAKTAFQEQIGNYIIKEAMNSGVDVIFGATPNSKKAMALLEDVLKKSLKSVEDDFMPESYREDMKDKPQYYYVKKLDKFGLLPDRGVFIRSFLIGVPIGLYRKYESQIEEVKKEQQKEASEANKLSLLIISNKEKLNKYIEDKHGKLKNMASNNFGDANAFKSGIQTAKNTHLDAGLNTGNGIATKLI